MNQNRVKQEYWCHTCSKKIKPRADKKPEIICSECNGDFVEIMEQENNNTQQTNTNSNNQQNTNQQNTNQNNNPRQQNHHHHHQIPFNLGELFGIPNIQVINLGQQNVEHNPLNGIQQFLQMLARNGNGGQNFFNFGGGIPGSMNMGDYVFGNQQFDEILTRLMEQAKGGAPPASKDALKELKLHKVTQTEIDEKVECSVCKDEYELDEEVKVMPCNHMFHKDCLDPWLQLRNTCPVCRFELKSKKEKEEDKKKENSNNNQEDMDDDEDDSHDERGFPVNPNSNPSNNNYYI